MLVCRNFLYSIGKSAEDHFAGTGKVMLGHIFKSWTGLGPSLHWDDGILC